MKIVLAIFVYVVCLTMAQGIDVPAQLTALLNQLRNQKVAFLTNPTGVDDKLVPLYQRVLDSKQTHNITLVCFFAPEHGLRGDRQAGAGDDDYVDQQTGLPVYSLYGKRLAPTAEQLATFDTLVYDIQDVGSRYYTYIWTLTYTMEALIKQNKSLVVFDRPNPLGMKAEGCVLSFNVGSIGRLLPGQNYTIPVRYGLTAGEFVRYVVRFMGNLKLTVIKMIGYDPTSMDSISPANWVPSSPNMPTLDTVLVYPGTGIFEGTSLSEGRGTTRPFELTGFGDLIAENVTRALQNASLKGCILRPAYFIPTFSKFQDKICGGVEIHVTNKKLFEPVRTAFHLLHTYYQLNQNVSISLGIDKMVGFSGFSNSIKFFNPDDVLENCKANLTLYEKERQSIFLYNQTIKAAVE